MVDHVDHFEERWADDDPTTTGKLNISREYCDWLRDQITATYIADWQAPFALHNTASTAFLKAWVDNTDSANIILRIKFGVTSLAATPASITDGMGVQLFSGPISTPI